MIDSLHKQIHRPREGVFDRNIRAAFMTETGHFHTSEAAGRDVREGLGGLSGDVDREAVHRDPFSDADAEGGEFARTDPHAGKAFAALGRYTVAGGKLDQQILEKSQIAVEIASPLSEVEDRVADELAGAVESRLSAPVGFKNRVGEVWAEARVVARAADRVDRLVLEKDEGFFGTAGLKLGDEVFLEPEGGLERHPARSEDFHRSAGNFAV